MYNTLSLHTLLCGCETWAVREQDKSRIVSAEMKFVWTTAKYMWKYWRSSEDIVSALKINSAVKKIQNYGSKQIQHVRRMDRQTATLNYKISTMWETKPRTTPLKTSRLIHIEITNKMQHCIKIYYSTFRWDSTCFWRHTAHHQELKNCAVSAQQPQRPTTSHVCKTRGC
jgi:hypothetical protein